MRPIQTILTLVATLALGFFFGLQVAGRLAYPGLGPEPAWVSQVVTLGRAALAVVLVCVIGVTLVYRHRMQTLGEWETDTEAES